MEPELSNLATPSMASSPITEGRKEGMFLPEAEIEATSPSNILGETAVTLEQTIPKNLTEAYNNSFVSLSKPEILNTLSQKQLLEHAEIIKNVSKQMIEDAEKDAEVTLAAQVLASDQTFLEHIQQKYNLYFAPGAIHQEQTDQNVPTILSELENNKLEQSGLQNAVTTIKSIAMKALVVI